MKSSSPVSSSFSRAATGHQPLQRLFFNKLRVGTLPSVLSIFRVQFLWPFAGFGIRFKSSVIDPAAQQPRQTERLMKESSGNGQINNEV